MGSNSIDNLEDFLEALSSTISFSDIKSKFCLLNRKVSRKELSHFERTIQQKNSRDLDDISNALSRLKDSYEKDYEDFVVQEKIDIEEYNFLRRKQQAINTSKLPTNGSLKDLNNALIEVTETVLNGYNFNIDVANLNIFITIVDYEYRYRDSFQRMESELIEKTDKYLETRGKELIKADSTYKNKVKDIIKLEGKELLSDAFFVKDLKTIFKLFGGIIVIIVTTLAIKNFQDVIEGCKNLWELYTK